MNILEVNAFESGGGAEMVASGLTQSFRAMGHLSWLLAGRQRRGGELAPYTSLIEPGLGRAWPSAMLLKAAKLRAGRFGSGLLRLLARPEGTACHFLGIEDFDFPSTAELLSLAPFNPDILHIHNLHGGYLDLRRLALLAQRIPLVLTLHDCWAMTGHCAHPFDCERWQFGCGTCPDLSITPQVKRDATSFNWRRKHRIFAAMRPNIVVPSLWLRRQLARSSLMTSAASIEVIENAVHDIFFEPADRRLARQRLNLAPDDTVLLFSANTVRQNIWKDFSTMRRALAILAAAKPKLHLVFIALGEEGPEEQLGTARIRYVPFQTNPANVAHYYHACDAYLHAAKAETFSLSVAEAMACARPVVATSVGAIPERVSSAGHDDLPERERAYGSSEATGLLVAPGDADALARAILRMLDAPDLAKQWGVNASRQARQRYRQHMQAAAYLKFFERVASDFRPG